MLERNGKHINLTPSGVVKLPIMKLNLKGKLAKNTGALSNLLSTWETL